MATPADKVKQGHTFRKFKDHDHAHLPWKEQIFQADHTHKCPTYVHQTPPCQGSCPSGEDIRGWLNIVRGIEKPSGEMSWQEYAFRRSTDANPFPAIMGRVCPAPCEDGCNRNEVEDHVGINAVEQFIGDNALNENYKFEAGPDTGKSVGIIGGGPCGLAAAYQLRRMGHACTVYDDHDELGGMMFYGIPGYRTPREVLGGEIGRITDMGVEVKLKTRVGTDISLDELEKKHDAVLFAIGAQNGRSLPIPGAEATNCISGVAFLSAFNQGRLQAVSGRVVVVGGGDTSIDVVSVARRLGNISTIAEKDRPENVVLGHTAHDVVDIAAKEGADVMLISRQPIESMNAAKHEIDDATREGVEIQGSLNPVEVIRDENGRAKALRVAKMTYESGKGEVIEGSEFDIEADLIVSAIGQSGDFRGMEDFANERGLMDADKHFQIPNKPGFFAAGDIVRPHLLTTVIGQASVVAETIDHYFKNEEMRKRPKVDVHHFNLLEKLRESGLEPEKFDPEGDTKTRGIDRGRRGTSDEEFAIHNYEDRSAHQIIPADKLFLGHFKYEPRYKRKESVPTAEEVLGHFEERVYGLPEEETVAEAKRCMSCGMCFECDNCVIYCPQDAVFKVKKDKHTMGRYVDTDYDRCIGCHICADVCPTGYIQMGLGE
ncbi:MAG: NAD(P)-binding protein [Gammaproteobacteria bacterium]|jgi:NADPH-dependent glutamate synthase beta subunit-like oxidoreductase/Pyruvate/2-oxoacid:ferredoxin oxidoreductase delta subunit